MKWNVWHMSLFWRAPVTPFQKSQKRVCDICDICDMHWMNEWNIAMKCTLNIMKCRNEIFLLVMKNRNEMPPQYYEISQWNAPPKLWNIAMKYFPSYEISQWNNALHFMKYCNEIFHIYEKNSFHKLARVIDVSLQANAYILS